MQKNFDFQVSRHKFSFKTCRLAVFSIMSYSEALDE